MRVGEVKDVVERVVMLSEIRVVLIEVLEFVEAEVDEIVDDVLVVEWLDELGMEVVFVDE